MDETAVYELQQLCTGGGLTQDSLSRLIDAGLSVPSLVRSDAAAMAQAKKAGLGMAERQALKEALRQHRDEVCSPPTTRTYTRSCAGCTCTARQHAVPVISCTVLLTLKPPPTRQVLSSEEPRIVEVGDDAEVRACLRPLASAHVG